MTSDAVRRNTRLLALAQVLLYTSAPIVLATGGPAAAAITARDGAVGAMIAVYFLAAAIAAPLVGRWMDRVGRRPGLLAGHAAVFAGAMVAAAGVAASSAAGLFAGAALIGAGAGAALLGRGAVADMYPPDRRARAVGLMLAASTVGAVAGAPLVAFVQQVSDQLGLDRMATPWLLIPVFEAVAIAAVIKLRPDPRELAVQPVPLPDPAGAGIGAGAHAADAPRTRRQLLSLAPLRAAIVAVVVAQATMVAVMAVAPVVVHVHGGGDFAVSFVLALHFAGMFAFMPWIGSALDRWGRRRGLLVAAAVCLIGVPLGGVGPATLWTSIAMFSAGLGWAGAYLGSTAIVSDVTTPSERAGALGMMDLLVSVCSAFGGLLGGLLLELGGFGLVTLVSGAVFVPVALVIARLREWSPGRWELAAGRAAAGN